MDSSSSSSPSPSEVTSNGQQQQQTQQSPMIIQDQTGTMTTTMSNNGNGTVLTPEQEEEMKLRMKYPNPQKPGGSTFIQKMLHKGCKKYFDSGDYNMAKSRTKAHGVAATNGSLAATAATGSVANSQAPSSGQFIPQQKIAEESINTPNTSMYSSPNITTSGGSVSQQLQASATNQSQGRLSTSPQMPSSAAALLRSNLEGSSSVTSTPSMSATTTLGSNQTYNNGHHTPSLHTRLSATNINNVVVGSNMNSPLVLFPSSSSSASSSSSTSTSSLHQPAAAATRQLLSSSTSASNINAAAAIDPVLLNAADEIGHGIPTPECLPQSRKHTISQSKLVATPRLTSN